MRFWPILVAVISLIAGYAKMQSDVDNIKHQVNVLYDHLIVGPRK